ncbi:hypothetical protein C2134_16680 [Chromobacterium sinusclupearum]|uniref:Uncharacterized protein n=1 Tax=Chromobacterium sinusclupearum TaxID=2077146 RepID=A0A2K4MK92_9NEIS|nr:hypothetical protein C2134_16680 [Chromobacterium sinusclupearum]
MILFQLLLLSNTLCLTMSFDEVVLLEGHVMIWCMHILRNMGFHWKIHREIHLKVSRHQSLMLF